MKLYFSITKGILVAFTVAFCLFIFIWGRFTAAKNIYKNGDTNAKRIYFMDALGYEMDEESVTSKEIQITSKTASKYGAEGYIGCNSILYQYYTVNGEKRIDLLIYNGRIIGVAITSSV